MPAIFAGLRIAAGLSVIGAIVGEFFFRAGDPSTAGLGRQLSVYQSQQRRTSSSPRCSSRACWASPLFAVFTDVGTRLTRNWSDRPAPTPPISAQRRSERPKPDEQGENHVIARRQPDRSPWRHRRERREATTTTPRAPTRQAAQRPPHGAATTAGTETTASRTAAARRPRLVATRRPAATARASTTSDLTGICPDPLVIQTDWFPEPDHGYTYQAIGSGG